ncbi:related to Ckb-2 casein kinase II subunit beta-2 [Rhynchosporium graminicola]|uniref:Casein kinase II subunit beta n=1 Tax=Rhynchosporium graminicola TaxID=2792576 RepID=A0A1E1JXY6_9HELO|nr:related to Ckb-2 casein kinase II subunit beta-2 [Rhynchosporium commune]
MDDTAIDRMEPSSSSSGDIGRVISGDNMDMRLSNLGSGLHRHDQDGNQSFDPSDSYSDSSAVWGHQVHHGDEEPYVTRFISSRGNEYFCEIDEDYLTDRFNLTGLNTEVQYYQYALDLVTDVFDLDCDDEMRETIEKSARHLYGLVHARYIVTTRGLAKMLDKYKKADFGKCPRVMCKSHPLLPMGQSDNPNVKAVKLYCAKCEDIYNPKSSRHSVIDGAYFGTSFHNIIFQVYPALIPPKSADRYIPRIYGFRVHAPATLIRWQDGQRNDMRKRLRKLEIESGFKDDEEEVEAEDSDDDEEDEEVEMEVLENGEMEGGELNNQI